MIASVGFDYEKHAAKQAEAWRVRVKSGQNIAPLPDITPEDLAEREACERDFARFCKTYFPLAFKYEFSPDHYRVIAKIEAAILDGMLAAFAMPRGYGKTVLSKVAAIWAILYGHRRWVVLVGATGPLAVKLLKDGIKPMLLSNNKLAKAFPEACKPARLANGSALKASGLHYENTPAGMVWEKDTLVFPRIPVPTCKCGESRVTCFGIEGALRGQVATLSTGEEIRPDLVLVDDPQTKASAKSRSQTQTRYEIIMGDILGLSGGDVQIAGLIPCTVIQKDDLSERLLSHEETQEMRGERTRLVYEFPTNDGLWEDYFRIRQNDLHAKGDGTAATQFYSENQAAMDAGAVVAWPERFPPKFVSAIEHAMYLRYRHPGTFAAEYQNDPVDQREAVGQFPTVQDILGKTNGFERGVVSPYALQLTGFIDVQQNALYWCVCAWEQGFTGHIVDYGCFPRQHQSYFDYRNLRHTLAGKYPNKGAEAAIYAGLTDLTDELFGREWRRPDGAMVQLGKLLIDSGNFTKTISSFLQNDKHRGVTMPSKGRGVTARNVAFGDFRQRPGERIGENWIIRPKSPNLPMQWVEIDTNSWKTFAQLRLATAIGDAGALDLFKATAYDHRCFVEHLTAENPVKTTGNGRDLWEWVQAPDHPDNHWLDCLVGCCVGASILGASLGEHRSNTQKKRVSLAELAKRAKRTN